MKKIIIYIILLISATDIMAQSNLNSSIVFNGTADTIYNGNTIVMYTKEKTDSAKIVDGKFSFTTPFNGPARYMFYSKYEQKKKRGYSPYGILVANPGTVNLKADAESMFKSVVSNAPENQLYNSFSSQSGNGRQEIMTKLNQKYGEENIKNLKETDANYKAVIAYYNDLNAAFSQSESERLEAFIKTNPNAFASVYLLYGMSGSLKADRLQKLYDQLGQKYRATSFGSDIKNKIISTKLTAIGQIAPDFEQADTAGKPVKLSSLRGKYVLLDFWASWCGPCRKENPNVVKAYQKFQDKGFTVLGVSLDQPGKKDNWIKAIHQDNLTWTHVSDLKFWSNEAAKLYGIQAIPQNFLLDKNGKIIAVNITGEDLNTKLESIFKN